MNIDLQPAHKLLSANAKAITSLGICINQNFAAVAEAISNCRGNLIITGIGKAGLIGAKISASFAATGTPSYFLHPTDALHGDLGRVRQDDLALILSYSGASEEIIRLIDPLKSRGVKLIALTGRADSLLARQSDWILCFGEVEEASPLGLVPSASTSCMLILGDALALTVMQRRQFSVEDLAQLHPAGVLGKKMLQVEEVMGFRLGENLPVVSESLTVREVLSKVSHLKRRCGVVLLINHHEKLSGIFTDGDLRRSLEKENGIALDNPISQVMTCNPKFIREGSLVADALKLIQQFRIDELPVLDFHDRPIGLIDVQDMIGFDPTKLGT